MRVARERIADNRFEILAELLVMITLCGAKSLVRATSARVLVVLLCSAVLASCSEGSTEPQAMEAIPQAAIDLMLPNIVHALNILVPAIETSAVRDTVKTVMMELESSVRAGRARRARAAVQDLRVTIDAYMSAAAVRADGPDVSALGLEVDFVARTVGPEPAWFKRIAATGWSQPKPPDS